MINDVEFFSNYVSSTYFFRPLHYRCVAHVINLVVQKGQFKSNIVLEKARKLVKHILLFKDDLRLKKLSN